MPVAGRRIPILCSLISVACLNCNGFALDASSTTIIDVHRHRQHSSFRVASQDEPSPTALNNAKPTLSRKRRAVRARTVHPGPVELGRVVGDEASQNDQNLQKSAENEVTSNGMVVLRKNIVDSRLKEDEAAFALLEFCMCLSMNHPSLRSR